MKKYVSPEMDLVLLDIENVITASTPELPGEVPGAGDNEGDAGDIFG